VEAGPEAFSRHVHPEDRARAVSAVVDLVAGRELPMQCFRVLRKDGRERFMLTHRTLERDASGQLLRLHGVMLDVTEQRLLQDSLRTMHANLEERVRERTRGLAETVRRLEEEVARRTRAEALARESEGRLRSLGDNLAGGAVFQLAREAGGQPRLAFASAGLAALVGAGGAARQPDLEQVLAAMESADRDLFTADLDRCLSGKRVLCREVRFLHPGGAQVWVRIQAAPRAGEAAEQICDGLAQDITDLKRAEEDRALAAQRLQRAHALARLGHWEYRQAESVGWWSDELYRSFGYEPQSRPITLNFFLSHIHPDDREEVAREFAAAVAEHREYRGSYRVIRKDGSLGFGYSLGCPAADSRPGRVVFHGTYLDVTEHRAAGEAIRAEAGRLRGLLDAAVLGTWVWEEGLVRHDAAACRIMGLDPAAGTLPMDQARALILPEDQGRLPDPTLPGPVEQPFRAAVRVRPPGGEVRRVLFSGVLYRNPKGRPTRAEGLVLGLDEALPE
jgi:PAS domain-containing protein